jgi:RNA polymerase sigma factor (TIGR02999 family)
MLQKSELDQPQAGADIGGEYQEPVAADPKFVAELEQLDALLHDPSLETGQLWNGLLDIAYTRLYRMASRLVGSPHGTPTLGATALVNEGYSRLMQSSDLAGIQDAHHFYRRFAMCMKHALIDHARSKLAEKRGGDLQRIDLEIVLRWFALPTNQFLELTDALEALAVDDPSCANLMELRYFGQMTIAELACLTSTSTATIERRLRFGKAYLREKLMEETADATPFASSPIADVCQPVTLGVRPT